MHALLALALTATSQLTIDGNVLTLTAADQRTFPTDVDVITVSLSATHPQEFDAALKIVNDVEERVQALAKKEELASIKVLANQATASATGGAAGGPVGGTVSRTLELRSATSPKTQLLLARLSNLRGVTSVTMTHDVADRKKALAQARRDAVENARAKAEDYATAIGRKLGKVTSLTENGESHQPPYAGMVFIVNTNVTLKFALD